MVILYIKYINKNHQTKLHSPPINKKNIKKPDNISKKLKKSPDVIKKNRPLSIGSVAPAITYVTLI